MGMLNRYSGRRRQPRGKGSNYRRTTWCARCDARTVHLFDHGEGVHLCTECEL